VRLPALLPSLLVVVALCVAASAHAQDAPVSPTDEGAFDSQSIGHTEAGSLLHAFALEPRDALATVRANHFGTRELVGLLERTADAVAREAPGSILAVGDLSSEHGGPLAPHGSHQSGRDADVGFFVLDERGQPVPQGMFVEFGLDGTGPRAGATVRFDDARNWAVLVALVDDVMAEVQHVLIVDHLRRRLLDYGRSIQAPEDAVRRVELVTAPIRGSENHDSHFHVRIYCSVGDRPECLDRPPLFPWYDGTPSPAALEAARIADLLRAAALRRQQAAERQADFALRTAEERQLAREQARAEELAREPTRQEALERLRAARLSAEQRRALAETRSAEAGLRAETMRVAAQERGRAAELTADERRWNAAEQRRAARLREQTRRAEADEQRRALAARAQQRRDAQLLRRSNAQGSANERRAAQLLRRSEQLARERARIAARQAR
jgi:penicillin-insensitive murein endopeptidase